MMTNLSANLAEQMRFFTGGQTGKMMGEEQERRYPMISANAVSIGLAWVFSLFGVYGGSGQSRGIHYVFFFFLLLLAVE